MTDNVSKPEHYARLNPEPLAVIMSWALSPARSNAIKYIARAGHKADEVEDIRKAIFYLKAELALLDGEEPFGAVTTHLSRERGGVLR